MRLTFPCCLLLIVLFGANMHAWGKAAVNPEPATAHQVFSWVDETDPDAPPMGVSSSHWLCHDAAGFENGPNLYAYVKENPWTAFDPDGLAETKPYYVTKGRKGIQKLEADPNDSSKPLTRTNADGKSEVQVNQYDVNPTAHFITGYKGESTGSSWEPAEKYGVKSPTASAKRNFETNNDPQANLQAIGEGANKPLVRGLNTAIRVTGTEATNLFLGGAVGALVLRSSANAAIRITETSMHHVWERHMYSGVSRYAAKSKFNIGEDVAKLIKQASNVKPVPTYGERLQRTFDAGRSVGIDRTTGNPTNIMTVITKRDGSLVTAHPGAP